MGEIADMMIGGDLCAECGSVLECEGFGIPIYCHGCHSQYAKRCSQPYQGGLCERFYSEAEKSDKVIKIAPKSTNPRTPRKDTE